MEFGSHSIPPSTLKHLLDAPTDRPVAVLIRHSVRDALPPNGVGFELPITPEGERLARKLGEHLRGRVRQVRSSPFSRCLQTGSQLIAGSEAPGVQVEPDLFLGQPGIFVEDPDVAWKNWARLGNDAMMQHLAEKDEPLPGMAPPVCAAHGMARHLFECAEDVAGLHLFVSHDTFVLTTAAKLIGVAIPSAEWPQFLEAVVFWRDGDSLCLVYRDYEKTLPQFFATRSC